MKVLFVLLHFFFFFIVSCNQNQPFKENITANYLPYYQLIAEAESHIVEDEVEAALEDYLIAYQSVPSVFAIDYFNGILCAIHSNHLNEAFEWSAKLVQKGCPPSFFEQEALKGLKQNKAKWRQFEADYDENRRFYEEHVHQNLQTEMAYLVKIDQEYYCRPNRDKQLLAIDSINERNRSRLFELIEEDSFPSEDIVGVRLKNDTLIADPHYYLLLLHQYQNGYFDWDNVLQKHVIRGELPPKEYAYLRENYVTNTIGNQILWEVEDTWYERKYSAEEMAVIHFNRKLFHLESHENYRKKVLYQYTNGQNIPVQFGFKGAVIVTSKKPPPDIWESILKMGAFVEL